MSDSAANGGCCRCCCSFILTSGLTALFMWLSLRASDPVCSIQDFYVPALNKTANSTSNHTIYLDLKLDNENKDKGIYYNTLNLTLYYVNDTSKIKLSVANYTLPQFYQGHKKNTHRKNTSETYGVPWTAALAAVSNGSTAVFKVELSTAVRFKVMAWKTKKHKLVVAADVMVNDSGKKVKKKGIKLKSGAPGRNTRYSLPALLLVAFCTTILLVRSS